jgi:endoglucanase
MSKYLYFLFFILVSSTFFVACEESKSAKENKISENIRLNQFGYYPNAIKKVVVADSVQHQNFQLLDSKTKEVVFEGKLSEPEVWKLAGEKVQIADFSDIKTDGSYQIYVEKLGYSYPFEIKKNVLDTVFTGSIRGMYYQRVSIPLEEKYAGKWHREMAHADDQILFHPSSGKTSGSINSPGGWYDAGDYNKYVINGSFPLGQFFLLQEQYPAIVKDNSLNIPESGNGISDYLDELKYEMDWLLTMQDDDGGLFHKLTSKNFQGMVMPNEANAQRYIVGKGTAATLDFAACAAQAYRVFENVDKKYADTCLEASKRAYEWALKNPAVEFLNPEDIKTGQYGDTDFSDEWFWANAELFVTTKDSKYLDNLKTDNIDFSYRPGDGWTVFMRFMGMFTMLDNKDVVPEALYSEIKTGILNSADQLVNKAKNLDYFQAVDDFQWGSNSDVLNTAMIMAQAYRLTKEQKYLIGVQQSADYILGNNAIGYSYVTGFGAKTPMFIHHRQSAGDTIAQPVPGLLSGGPNSRLQDVGNNVIYPENPSPMKAWADQEESFASNEICLNWNAPLTYILGFLEQESN